MSAPREDLDSARSMARIEKTLVELIEKRQIRIPPFPPAAMRLSRLLAQERYSLAELVSIVATDQVLAAKVLRTANSALVGGRAIARTLNDAIVRLGAQELLNLSYASGLGAASCAVGPLQDMKLEAWSRFSFCAEFCRRFSAFRGISSGEAYLCGLLFDFGRTVAIACLEDLLKRHAISVTLDRASWGDIVERHHVAVGAIIADKWRLPAIVMDAMVFHHEADAVAVLPENQPMLEVVRVADRLWSLVSGQAIVRLDDLGSIEGLRDLAERHFILDIVPELASSMMGVEPDVEKAIASSIAIPATTIEGELVPADFAVVSAKKNETSAYRCVAINEHGLVLVGARQQLEHFLAQFLVSHAHLSLEFLGKVSLCKKEDTEFRLEVQPFALGRETKGEWLQLVAAARGETVDPVVVADTRDLPLPNDTTIDLPRNRVHGETRPASKTRHKAPRAPVTYGQRTMRLFILGIVAILVGGFAIYMALRAWE